MDKLQDYEVDAMIKNIPYTDINLWEQCRLKIYTTSQMVSKKKLSVKDIMSFPWDKGTEENKTSITNEEIENLNKLSEQIRKDFYGK